MPVCECMLGFPEDCNTHDETNPLVIASATEAVTEDNIKEKIYVDPKSTGRKIAVQVKPITQGFFCDWAGLKYAGGGVYPIVGCIPNKNLAKQVHHGPNKDTMDNRPENLHRVCNDCHGRWHTLNDPTYAPDVPGTTWLPQGEFKYPDYETKATVEELARNESYWRDRKSRAKSYTEQISGKSSNT